MHSKATDWQTGKKIRLGVLGSGKGSNMQAILDAINAGSLSAEIACVISDVENAGILARAQEHGIPHQYISAAPYRTKLEGAAENEYIKVMHENRVDVVVLAGFMRIIKAEMLKAFRHRMINIHPSLLPAFPGLHAWRQALDYGAKITGCTVHFVDEGTDTGPVIIQRSVPVMDDDTPESLHARIQVEEHIAYPEALKMISNGELKIEQRRVLRINAHHQKPMAD